MITRLLILFSGLLIAFTGCRNDEAPLPATDCLFNGQTPFTDTTVFADAYFRFRVGNQWTYTVNFYRADTIYDTQTQTSTVTGWHSVSGDYWWVHNNSPQAVLMTSSNNTFYDLYNQDGAGCAENHLAFAEAITDTIRSDYTNGSGATVYECYFVPVNDTLIFGMDTFFTKVKKYNFLYNQPSVGYFAPQVGLVYSKQFFNTTDTTAYREAILTNYYIR